MENRRPIFKLGNSTVAVVDKRNILDLYSILALIGYYILILLEKMYVTLLWM